jgi:ABC-type dipeptide/oligopeptide/nickel transport system permease component
LLNREEFMAAYLIRRIMQSLLILFAMSVLVFLAIYMLGNPVDALLSPDADQAERAAAIARLGTPFRGISGTRLSTPVQPWM